jgi:hypothetical protein
VVGDYNGEVLCTDSGTCVTWSASVGMWSPDPATPCWGGDALCRPGQVPIATGNLGHDALDNAVNLGIGAPFGAGLSAADIAAGARAKVALHEAHHAFWGTNMRHIQMTIWRVGVKGSGINLRVPWPW